MTREQQKDLFVEWDLYDPRAQQLMIDDYNSCTSKRDCSCSNFLDFLKDKLENQGYIRQKHL